MLIPTVVEKTNNREIAYDLYSRLLNDNIILIEGEITDTSSNIIVSELLYLNSKNNDEIDIDISEISLSKKLINVVVEHLKDKKIYNYSDLLEL